MVAIQNVVLAVAAGAAAVVQASSNPLSAIGSAIGLKVRGTNNVFDERAVDPFAQCREAVTKAEKKPVTSKGADNTVTITDFPAVCATEAKAFKPKNGMTIEVAADKVTLHNAPAEILADF